MPDSGITKKALALAMKELMSTKAFSKISVSDICEKCNMNRKSFYYHFQDKYDLVNWIYYTEFIGNVVQSREYTDPWELLADISSYFYENREFYKNAFDVTGQNSFRDYFKDILKPILFEIMGEVFENTSRPEFTTSLMADIVLLGIMKWMEESPDMIPDEFIGLMKEYMYGFSKKVIETMDETE